jgi:hypothetical protein
MFSNINAFISHKPKKSWFNFNFFLGKFIYNKTKGVIVINLMCKKLYICITINLNQYLI